MVKTLIPVLVFVATFALVQALYVLFVLVRKDKPRRKVSYNWRSE